MLLVAVPPFDSFERSITSFFAILALLVGVETTISSFTSTLLAPLGIFELSPMARPSLETSLTSLLLLVRALGTGSWTDVD